MSPDEERVLWFAPVFCAESGEYPDLDSMRRGMTQFNDAAKAVADERGTAFVDFDASVPKDQRHFVDDVHMNRAGNNAIAEAAARWISEHLPASLRQPAAPGS